MGESFKLFGCGVANSGLTLEVINNTPISCYWNQWTKPCRDIVRVEFHLLLRYVADLDKSSSVMRFTDFWSGAYWI